MESNERVVELTSSLDFERRADDMSAVVFDAHVIETGSQWRVTNLMDKIINMILIDKN